MARFCRVLDLSHATGGYFREFRIIIMAQCAIGLHGWRVHSFRMEFTPNMRAHAGRGMLFAAALFATGVAADTNVAPLKLLAPPTLRIGTAIGHTQLSSADPAMVARRALIAHHFSTATPENAMKWQLTEPQPGLFTFGQADTFMDYAEANTLWPVGHTLVWHSQTPDWVFSNATREVLLNRMSNHIHAVAGRYRGRIKAWDVVNEALNENGSYRTSRWHQIIGPDYIVHAFRFARQADPDAELYYNDYNIESPNKRTGVVHIVRQLQAAGERIDGIGIQGHYRMGSVPFDHLRESILAFAGLGLKVAITELDIGVLPLGSAYTGQHIDDLGALKYTLDPYTNGLPPNVEAQLAADYEKLFRLLASHADRLDRVTFWGPTDLDSWLNNWPIRGRTEHPLLFDRDAQPKRAYHAVTNVLAEAAAFGGILDGLRFNWSASRAAGTAWTSSTPATVTTQRWTFGGAMAPEPVSSSAPGLTNAVRFGPGRTGTSASMAPLAPAATFEWWIKPDSLTGGKQVIFETGGTTKGLSLTLWNNELRLALKRITENDNDPPGVVLARVLEPGDLTDFIQVLAVLRTNVTELYVHPLGRPGVASTVATGRVAIWDGTNDSGLGGIGNVLGASSAATGSVWHASSFTTFSGLIHAVRVYERPLAGAEIQTAYKAVAGSLPPEPPPNLLTNPGFETGTTAGWGALGSPTIRITTNVPFEGRYMATVSNRQQTWHSIRQQLGPVLTNGNRYVLSARARIQGAPSAVASLVLKITDATGDHYQFPQYALLSSNGWTRLMGEVNYAFTPPLTEAFMYINAPAGIVLHVDAGGCHATTIDRIDLNLDGLPDRWQELHFGSETNPLAHPKLDLDGDGFSNREEWLAGTDPGNGLLFPIIPAILNGHLTLNTTSGRIHRVEGSPSLSPPQWTTLTTIIGNGSSVAVPMTGPEPAGYLRYATEVAP